MNIDQKVELLVNRYNESKRTDQYEPSYVIAPYDTILAYAGLSKTEETVYSKFKKLLGKSQKKGVDALKEIYGGFSNSQLMNIFEGEALDSMLTPDGTVSKGGGFFPDRVIHDGFKVGTTSWVFMGRKNSPVVPVQYHGKTLYAIKRDIPAEIYAKLRPLHPECDNSVWIAYDLDGQYGLEIGPCISLDHIHQVAAGDGHISIRSVKGGF